jgi:hypothetical protein
MLLSESQLRTLIAGKSVGDRWPYFGGTDADIENHLHRVVDALRSTGLLEIDADFDHYGSGYASYVHVSCEKRGGGSRARRDNADRIEGLAIYLSRLTPLAVYGSEERYISAAGGSRGFIDVPTLYSVPSGDWQVEIAAIRRTLESLGFTFPPRDQLAEPLPFEADIPTILDDVHVYGAIFYWED